MAEDAHTFEADGETVSALWLCPPEAKAALVLAHGAGVGMRHRFMADVASGLADRSIATFRFQFPYMEAGRKRPDPPAKAVAAIRAAIEAARPVADGLPLLAGGKSFGGRMTSTAESEGHLEGVEGIVFFGFPLHAPGKPGLDRADHLAAIELPMLFLQGTRDRLAEIGLIEELCGRLGSHARLEIYPEADHSFHVPKSSGRSDTEIMATMLDAVADFASGIANR